MKATHVGNSDVFGEYGWPDTLLTDNGPCYASHEFKQLMLDKKWFPATIFHLLDIKRSYLIRNPEGVESEKHNSMSTTAQVHHITPRVMG